MTKQLQTDLEQAVVSNDWDKVQSLMDDFFTNQLPAADQGGALVAVVQAYARLTTAINKEYSAQLKEGISLLRKLNRVEVQATDALAVEDIKDKLAKMD